MFLTRTKPTGDVTTSEVWRRGCNDPSTIDGEILFARLAEAVIWCERNSGAGGYRTSALRLSHFHEGPDDLVCGLGSSRQRQLQYEGLSVPSEAPVIAPGRFMVYFPDENLCDGYAELVSDGFFDVDNLPAHDTWVSLFNEAGRLQAHSRRYLLCYVPFAAIEAASAGIKGNPEQCIAWLDRSDVSIRQRVEQFAKGPWR